MLVGKVCNLLVVDGLWLLLFDMVLVGCGLACWLDVWVFYCLLVYVKFVWGCCV